MSQTTTNTQPFDLEALRLQLEEHGKVYCGNPNPKDARERLLHTLQTNDCQEIVTQVVDGDDLANVFAWAGIRSHVDLLEAYLHHGMNIDIKDQYGGTALIGASLSGQEECVRFLLDHNANVDVQGNLGQTALTFPSQCGFVNIVEMLLEKNANPDIQNKRGMTALMLASWNSRKEVIKMLLTYSADVELKNNDGRTALDLAKNEEIKEMIRNHVDNSFVLK